MGSRNIQSRRRPSSHLGFAAIIGVVSACSLTKKEEPAPVATTNTVVPAAPVFNVTPAATSTPTPQPATPDPTPSRAADVKGKGTTGGAGGAPAKATGTQAGGSTSAGTTAGTTAGKGGTTAKSTTSAVTLPTVDMACINGCATKFQACVAAAGLDGTKLAACQSVVTNCQNECKAK